MLEPHLIQTLVKQCVLRERNRVLHEETLMVTSLRGGWLYWFLVDPHPAFLEGVLRVSWR